jgi:hypothetical protein
VLAKALMDVSEPACLCDIFLIVKCQVFCLIGD